MLISIGGKLHSTGPDGRSQWHAIDMNVLSLLNTCPNPNPTQTRHTLHGSHVTTFVHLALETNPSIHVAYLVSLFLTVFDSSGAFHRQFAPSLRFQFGLLHQFSLIAFGLDRQRQPS
jgi:hypothetical protein